jgi:hypothetical protein
MKKSLLWVNKSSGLAVIYDPFNLKNEKHGFQKFTHLYRKQSKGLNTLIRGLEKTELLKSMSDCHFICNGNVRD